MLSKSVYDFAVYLLLLHLNVKFPIFPKFKESQENCGLFPLFGTFFFFGGFSWNLWVFLTLKKPWECPTSSHNVAILQSIILLPQNLLWENKLGTHGRRVVNSKEFLWSDSCPVRIFEYLVSNSISGKKFWDPKSRPASDFESQKKWV